MDGNDWLQLNDEKTLLLMLQTPTVGRLSKISDIIIDNNITLSPPARNLGSIFDEHLTMQ